jgi:hypothetical protein
MYKCKTLVPEKENVLTMALLVSLQENSGQLLWVFRNVLMRGLWTSCTGAYIGLWFEMLVQFSFVAG